MKRETFLQNLSQKLKTAVMPDATLEHPGSFTGYSWREDEATAVLTAQFKKELEALTGHVHLLDDVEETADCILGILASHNAKRLIAWEDDALGLPNLRQALGEAGIGIADAQLDQTENGRKATLANIDNITVGLTGAHGGLADNGAVALINGSQRGRLPSLAPPVHIALLRRQDIYPSLPAFLAAHPSVTEDNSNLVFIAGPSRTGDIEMTLSIGVHGPGEVHVIVLP